MKAERDKFKAIIIEGESKTLDVLSEQLSFNRGIELLGQYSTIEEYNEQVGSLNPDIIFLDLDIPGEDGFEFIDLLNNTHMHPCVICASADEKKAIPALRHYVFDFLQKPIRTEELTQCLNRFLSYNFHCCFKDKIDKIFEHLYPDKKIRFNTAHGFILISLSQIVYCLADWNYSEVWLTKKRKEVVPINLGKIERMLPDYMFIRINRSIIINKNFIEKLNRRTRMITVAQGENIYEFKVSLSKVKVLME